VVYALDSMQADRIEIRTQRPWNTPKTDTSDLNPDDAKYIIYIEARIGRNMRVSLVYPWAMEEDVTHARRMKCGFGGDTMQYIVVRESALRYAGRLLRAKPKLRELSEETKRNEQSKNHTYHTSLYITPRRNPSSLVSLKPRHQRRHLHPSSVQLSTSVHVHRV
jgi:hypothetical protein